MAYEPTKPRGPIGAMTVGPGPCYKLPGLVGTLDHDTRSNYKKDPAYQFGLKHKTYTTDTSPGPVYSLPPLKCSHKNTSPQWTLSPRAYPPDSKLKVPGPGEYELIKASRCVTESAPAYTFGLRPRGRKTDNQPSPNNYCLPVLVASKNPVKSSAPQYTMVGRSKVGGFSEDLQQTPGPSAYSTSNATNSVKDKAPAYSMTGRNVMPSDATIKPGPGAHAVEKSLGQTLRKQPAYSFGIRHSQFTAPVADLGVEE